MTTDEELRQAIDALGESVLLVGGDPVGESVVARVAGSDIPATDTADEPDAVILIADASQAGGDPVSADLSVPSAPVSFAAVLIPERPESGERTFLTSLTDAVETVVLVSGETIDELVDAVTTLVSITRESGVVNVDLADVQTVFELTDVATLAVGSDESGDPEVAVRNAFGNVPNGIETDSVSGVIVDVVGTPAMTVGDISDAVSTVRRRVGPDAHVIWGGAVDESVEGTLRVRLVLAGVKNVRVAPGDRCPRCETRLSAYTLDGRTVPSCEACGYAGISVRLRD